MTAPNGDERGILLLEVMVALVLLGGFGLGMLSAVRAALTLENEARTREAASADRINPLRIWAGMSGSPEFELSVVMKPKRF